jgi:hypothetical protein
LLLSNSPSIAHPGQDTVSDDALATVPLVVAGAALAGLVSSFILP